MPKLKEGQLPKYRLHRQSGQAIVTLSGRDFLLGKHGSAASKQEYRRLTGEWLAGKRSAGPAAGHEDLTVAELVLAFWRHAQTYYRGPDGRPTTEVSNLKPAMKLLRQSYGRTRATDFGPRALKALLAEMIRLGWCRTNINRQLPRIKMVFKWAVSNELVPASVHHALVTVSGLRRGRSEARGAEIRRASHRRRAPAIALWRQGRGRQSVAQYATTLNGRITSKQAKAWAAGSPLQWAMESQRVSREVVYAEVPAAGDPPKLGPEYVAKAQPVVDEQIQKAGVRLAMTLNLALDDASAARH